MRRSSLTLLCLPLALAACSAAPVRSTWAAQPPPANGPDPAAVAPAALTASDMDLWASNDGKRLYLTLSSVAEHVKDQWMGVYSQSLLIFLDPSERHPGAEGLRLTLDPPAGVAPPWDPHREQDYVMGSGDRLERVRRRPSGGLEAVPIRPQDADWEIHFEGPRLVHRLSLPLTQAQCWDLGLAPGRHLGVRVETTAIEPHLAMNFRLAHEPAKVSGTAKAGAGKAASQPPADAGSLATQVRQDAALANAMDAQRLDPTRGGAQATRIMEPYPAPNQVPDPLQIDLQLLLAPAPRPKP